VLQTAALRRRGSATAAAPGILAVLASNETLGETLQERNDASARVVAAKPHLFVVLEGDRLLAGGARASLHEVDEVVIGRGRERRFTRERVEGRRRLIVQIPGKWMSSVHARLVRTRGAWVIEDAGSRNGTLVGGEPVTRRTLDDGDVFEAGHALFAFHAGLPTPSASADDVDSGTLDAAAGMRTLVPSLVPELDELAIVAKSDVPIVLLGETGTGKEVLARAVHALSGRAGAFVAVNCGGLSAALVEGLLYGHTKGSFTGAMRDEAGFVRAAQGGTLFLDELGDFPVTAQPSLLRVLQEREVVPLGASRPVPVDFRVVAATHRDVDALVESGALRQDLLMRVNGFRHSIPPLRQRAVDLGLLVAELIARRAGDRAAELSMTGAAARALMSHSWRGNVRELEQVLGRAVALAREGVLEASMLGLPAPAPPPAGGEAEPADDVALRETLVAALTRAEGNVSEVARTMGKARMQVQRWMQRFGIDPETYRRSK
jgi:hypothetical protein